MENIVKAIYDNSSGTDYKYTVYTDDGKTLYINEKINLQKQDRFICDLSDKKISKKTDKEYYTASNVRKLGDMEEPPQHDYPDYSRETEVRTVSSNGNGNYNSGLRVDASMFITGIVTRSMGSGQFGISDIDQLTAEAVKVHKKYFG